MGRLSVWIVVLALAVAGLVLLFGERGRGDGAGRRVSAGGTRRPGETIERSDGTVAPETAVARGTRREVGAPRPRVGGRVELPGDEGRDEELRVVALVGAESFSAPVAGDGSFEVELPAGAYRGALELRERYLYLPADVAFDLRETDEYTLVPLLGARLEVEVRVPETLASAADLRAATTVELASSTPGGDRRVVLSGSWQATFDALSTDTWWSVHAANPRLYDGRRGPLRLEPGRTLHLGIDLVRGVRLAGIVQRSDGRPAVGVNVTAQSLSDTGRFATDASTVASDETGSFRFEGLRPGLLALRAAPPDAPPGRLDLDRLADGEEHTGIRLILGAGTALAGSVQWPDGGPAGGARVTLGSQYGAHGAVVELVAEEQGQFQGEALSSPPYRVRAAAIGPQGGNWHALLEGVSTDDRDWTLILAPGNHLAGRVVDDSGRPIERFTVAAQPVGTGGASGLERMREKFEDDDGRFAFDDLPDGDWDIVATANGTADGAPQRVGLPAMAGARLELVLPREGTIGGVVREPDGTLASGGSVRAQGGASPRTARVDATGHFALTGVPPGVHRLTAHGVRSTWGPEEVVRLAPGEIREGVALQAAPGARITGTLHPSLEDLEGRSVLLANRTYTFQTRATADAQGRFEFADLPPDEYRVYLEFVGRGGLDREWAENYAARAEERVRLAPGEHAAVVVGAPRTGGVTVAGRLTLTGEPLGHQLVYVYPGPPGEDFPITAGYAAEDGHFEIRLPGPGDYEFSCAPNARYTFGRRVSVPDQSTFELTIALGTGRLGGTVIGPQGEPRPAQTLLLRRASAAVDSLRPGDLRTTKTDATGAFLFEHVEDGRWELRSGGLYNDQRTRVEGIAVRSDLVVEHGGAIEGVVLNLRRGALLSGRCELADGSPVANARLRVRYADGSAMLPLVGEHSDWDGAFRIPAVDPGTVEVHAEFEGRRTPAVRVELAEAGEGYVELSFQ